MNKQILENYRNLSETAQAELRHKYRDSPIGLRLIDFLATTDRPDFKTAEAVTYIYGNTSHEEFATLENRFFKLRKKMLDELLEKSTSALNIDLPEEEAELNLCKHIIATGDKKEAYKRLVKLEKLCWERNLFELLPAVLDNMIFCNQVANDIEKNKALFPLLKESVELNYDLNRANYLRRQIYEVALSKGPSHSKNLMAVLKEMGLKHSKYPRFIMFYHYESLTYKLTSMDYTRNMQVISRHLAEFNKLYAKHPYIPIVTYRANHAKLFHFHFTQIKAFIHNNRQEYEEAYECMKEMADLTNSPDSVYRNYRSDTLYFNLFCLQCVTGRYREAFQNCDRFALSVKAENRLEKISFVNTLRALLYVTAYPQTFKMDRSYLFEQLDEYIKWTKKNERVQLPMAQAMLIKAQLYLVADETKTVSGIIKDTDVQAFLQSNNAADLYTELIHVINTGNTDFAALKIKAQQRKFNATKVDELMTINWLINYINRVSGK